MPMSFFLRLFGFVVLLLSLAHAQLTSVLEIPGDGTTVSGIGVISGWKCEVEGDITISLNGEAPFPAMYGLPRSDTSAVCGNDGNNGFFSYTNWGDLGDGEHTAVAYDDGEKFAESTFTVTTPGTGFLRGASKQVTVDDFPNPGDTTVLEWNEGTQHFEIVDFMGSECVEGLTLQPGEMCSSSLPFFGHEVSFIFAVNADGQACVEVDVPPDFPVGIPEIPCFDTDQDFEKFLSDLQISGADVTKNDDGSWTIHSFPDL